MRVCTGITDKSGASRSHGTPYGYYTLRVKNGSGRILWCFLAHINSLDFTSLFYIFLLLIYVFTSIITSMARNSLLCADVPLRNYSLTHSLTLGAEGQRGFTRTKR